MGPWADAQAALCPLCSDCPWVEGQEVGRREAAAPSHLLARPSPPPHPTQPPPLLPAWPAPWLG